MNQKLAHETPYEVVRFAPQVVPQLNTQHHVLVSTKSHGFLTIWTRITPINCHHSLAARGIMNISPDQPFYVLNSNVFDGRVCLPKHTIIAQCGTHSNVSRAINFNNQNDFPIEGLERDTNLTNSSAEVHSNFYAVHYKPADDKQLQTLRHIIIQNDIFFRLAKLVTRRSPIRLLIRTPWQIPYHANHISVNVGWALWSYMRSKTEYQTCRLEATTWLLCSILCWTDKARVQGSRIEKVLSQTIIELAQTNSAAPIVFKPIKTEHYAFALITASSVPSKMRLVFDTTNGGMCRLSWQSRNFLHLRC